MVPDDVEKAMKALGLEIVKTDDVEVTARCPGHKKRLGRDDRNPSWSVNRQTGVHHCFSCGFGGTFMELVMERLGENNIYRATKFILSQGVSIDPEVDLKKYVDAKAAHGGAPPEQTKPLDEARLHNFADVPDKELKKRNLTREAVDRYGIRWSEADSCWILPIRLPSGALIGWQKKQGRFVRNYPEGVKKAQTFFGIEYFEEGMIPVVVESQLDVARFASIPDMDPAYCALAQMGSKLSAEQQRILISMSERAIMAPDNPAIDPAGAVQVDRLLNGKTDKWGNRIEEPLIKRLPLQFLNYESGAKDIGDMDDDEIHSGIDNALSPLEALKWITSPLLSTPLQ